MNFTFWINSEETYGNKVNGTYIYKVDTRNKITSVVTRRTITIEMLLASMPRTVSSINITLPFDEWYQLYKNYIPFHVPSPKVKHELESQY